MYENGLKIGMLQIIISILTGQQTLLIHQIQDLKLGGVAPGITIRLR